MRYLFVFFTLTLGACTFPEYGMANFNKAATVERLELSGNMTALYKCFSFVAPKYEHTAPDGKSIEFHTSRPPAHTTIVTFFDAGNEKTVVEVKGTYQDWIDIYSRRATACSKKVS